MWDKTSWNTSSFLIVVEYYSINKFYETILIITNKKGHQKLTLLGHSKKKNKHNRSSSKCTSSSEFISYANLTPNQHRKKVLLNLAEILNRIGESTIRQSRIGAELSTMNQCHVSTWIQLSKLMKYRRTFNVEFQCQIDGKSIKMCSLGVRSFPQKSKELFFFFFFFEKTKNVCF